MVKIIQNYADFYAWFVKLKCTVHVKILFNLNVICVIVAFTLFYFLELALDYDIKQTASVVPVQLFGIFGNLNA